MPAQTGIAAIGTVEWGTHFCHFYKTAKDLADMLVPFFKAGLEADEACLWVTAEPLGKGQAYAALNASVDNLDRRLSRGQVAIYDRIEWYDRHESKSGGEMAAQWIGAKDEALGRGYRGLRLTGNTAFLEQDEWDDFIDYERSLREAFSRQQLLALCSYHSGRCDADAVLDVVQAHDFALARRCGRWEVIESAAVRTSKEALSTLNAHLERRIEERTAELADALAHRRLLTAELSHRVKNTIASVQTIVEQSLGSQPTLEQARVAVRGRIVALGQVHDRLAAADWRGVGLRDMLGAALKPYAHRIRLELNGEVLTPRAALDLALVFHELLTNATKYGALSRLEGVVRLSVQHQCDGEERLLVRWQEEGGPRVAPPQRQGFGTLLIRQIVTHNLRGECELEFRPEGLACTFHAPASEILVRQGACCGGGR